MHRTIYVASGLAAGVLIDELAFWVLTRTRDHLIDRGVRALDRLRAAARI